MSTEQEVARLAHALVEADSAVEDADKALKKAKEHARQIREEDLPGAMEELGVASLTLSTGEKISTKLEVYASIPAKHKEEAFTWLEENGFAGLIKSEIGVSFSREEKERARELANQLSEQGMKVALKLNVHPQTLKAFIKEQLESGRDMPLELFGARPVTTATVRR